MRNHAMRNVRPLLLLALILAWAPAWGAQPLAPAILVIGASYENAATPFNDALQAPLGGISVNAGSYISLGNALARSPLLDGFVINEAQAGATTFDRLSCEPGPPCGPAGWQGFDKQFGKALARVTVRNPADPSQVLFYNADYVLIGGGNDCLHSAAFGVPQDQAVKCGTAELNAFADRLIAPGKAALAIGITPIYYRMPAYNEINLPLMASLYGFSWILNEQEYTEWRDLVWTRLRNEVPEALFVDAWENFTTIGDGLHPSPKTVERAAERIAEAITIDRALKRKP